VDGLLHWIGAQLTEVEGLCRSCRTRVERVIREAPADVHLLGRLLGATGEGGGERVRGSRELTTPLRLGIDALRGHIDFELSYWAEVLSAELGSPWDSQMHTRSRTAARVQQAAAYLLPRVDALIKLGPQERYAWTQDGELVRDADGECEVVERSGLEGALRLVELHHRVRHATGRTHLVHRLTPACPWCDQCTLVRHNGSDTVECESCGRLIPERHYSWFVGVLVEQEQRLAREAA